MNAGSIVMAVMIGMLLPLQALINAALGRQTQGPLFASLVSFLVGTAVLVLCWLATRTPSAQVEWGRLPWWAWTGGLIGALYVAMATVLVPRMGAAALICLIVFGQVLGSLLLDHYGVLHARQPIDAGRIIGAVLVVAGALLVVRPWQGAHG